ncbi:type II secretion system minor pseudopilin GspI [Hyphomonas sp.]|uniref:type II secretion system minor pseudopilin GspI n=1 Tax=Hyphomonas sp. TaxID=87 RepID=UPI0032EDF909
MPDHSSQSGFTLVEVIAALGVFSISAIGLIHLNSETTVGAKQVDMRALAEIEASNRMADTMTLPLALSTGVTAGDAIQRGRTFDWTRAVTPTQEDGLYLIEVTVSAPETGQVLARVQALRAGE